MTRLAGADAAEIPFNDSDFNEISRIAKDAYGLHLETSKKALIRSRLNRRIHALGLASFKAYCAAIRDGAPAERDHFVSALTTNVTHFYRETHHFEFLEATLLPLLLDRARRGARVRLWSAGCSTGQEPYSLAGSLVRLCPDVARLDLRILATDLDSEVLRRAEAATYRADECRFPTPDWRDRVFARGGRTPSPEVTVREDVRALVTFRPLNLNGPWPVRGPFDAILCRNVAIYFDRATQERLWARFAELMPEGAHLFIGHSERIVGAPLDLLENVGITTYRRKARRPAA